MKRLIVTALCMAALAASAAKDPTYKDPNPYADYGDAMASVSNRISPRSNLCPLAFVNFRCCSL